MNEQKKCVCGREEILGHADVEIGGVCHREELPCYIVNLPHENKTAMELDIESQEAKFYISKKYEDKTEESVVHCPKCTCIVSNHRLEGWSKCSCDTKEESWEEEKLREDIEKILKNPPTWTDGDPRTQTERILDLFHHEREQLIKEVEKLKKDKYEMGSGWYNDACRDFISLLKR